MSRILFIITQSEIGGAQRYLLELAPYLVSRGYDVSIAAGEGNQELFKRLRETCNLKPETYYYIQNLVRNLNPIKDLIALFFLIKIITKIKPEILFLQSTKAGFIGALAARLFKLYCFVFRVPCFMRIIYRIGGWAFNDPRPWYMNKIVFWMEKISAPWKDIIIVNSEFDHRIAIGKKIAPSKKIVKIYNGIDQDALKFLSREEARRKLELRIMNREPDNKILIGTIANLYATKGIKYLIEAARILTKNYPPTGDLPQGDKLSPYEGSPAGRKTINYIVIGEGKERPKLEALIKKYGLQDKFFLMGRIPDAAQYLRAFDVFVLPSCKEGFPWVLLEAMAAQVPIVATKVGAVPEVIEGGKDGLLVPPKNAHELAQKIISFVNIQNGHDRGYFVTRAKEKLKQFSLQKMLKESEALLN